MSARADFALWYLAVLKSTVSTYASWLINLPNVYSGLAPVGCTPTIGEAYLKLSVDRLAGIFDYVKRCDACEEVMEELKLQ